MTDPITTFDALCSRAVKAFMQTVVVIDNEASLASDASGKPTRSAVANRKRPTAPGKATIDSTVAVDDDEESFGRKADDQDIEPSGHRLDLNKVSQAFAEHGLTCGVYLPTDNDSMSREGLIQATVDAILPTDACVLDWQLRVGDSSPAVEAIKKVLETDLQEGGRLRLILIYTAERLEDASPILKNALEAKHYQISSNDSDQGPLIIGDHFRIIFVSKPTLGRKPGEDPAVVDWSSLPARIISEFSILSRGLLRAFALESVAAVRRDIHRILAQFDSELDSVYAADRATKPDPDDAGRLMVEVLQSELSLSIAESQAEKNVLGAESSILWLESRAGRLPKDCVVSSIRREGELNNITDINNDTRITFLKDGFRDVKSSEKQGTISQSFFNSRENWEKYSSDYAVLTTLAHHSGERAGRPPSENPLLQFGAVIGDASQILLCIQPACDAVRLQSNTAFLFVRLISETSNFDLIIPNADTNTRYQIPDSGKLKHLRELKTLWFNPLDGKDFICAQKNDDGKHFFIDGSGTHWEWRAQLREMTAVQLAQKAISPISRIGSNQFEWLRTNAK